MLTVKHTITGYDVLPNGYIKPSAMLKYMQDGATMDAAGAGADYDSLRSRDMIFVVSKVLVNFVNTPKVDDVLEIRTWNSGTQGVSFIRNYVMTVNDRVVGTATTRWVLVSYSARRILRPDALFTDLSSNVDELLPLEPSRRLRLMEGIAPKEAKYTASFTDMDTNYHVNNTRYGDLIVDYSALDMVKNRVSEFEIHFVSELKAGQTVSLSSTAEGNASVVTAVKDDGLQVFTSRISVESL